MKNSFKILSAAILLALSFQGQAKAKSTGNDDFVAGSACLVEFKTASNKTFLNVLYIKSLTLSDDDVVNVYMASNYSSRSNYSVKFPTKDAANLWMSELVYNINNCNKPR